VGDGVGWGVGVRCCVGCGEMTVRGRVAAAWETVWETARVRARMP